MSLVRLGIRPICVTISETLSRIESHLAARDVIQNGVRPTECRPGEELAMTDELRLAGPVRRFGLDKPHDRSAALFLRYQAKTSVACCFVNFLR